MAPTVAMTTASMWGYPARSSQSGPGSNWLTTIATMNQVPSPATSALVDEKDDRHPCLVAMSPAPLVRVLRQRCHYYYS